MSIAIGKWSNGEPSESNLAHADRRAREALAATDALEVGRLTAAEAASVGIVPLLVAEIRRLREELAAAE